MPSVSCIDLLREPTRTCPVGLYSLSLLAIFARCYREFLIMATYKRSRHGPHPILVPVPALLLVPVLVLVLVTGTVWKDLVARAVSNFGSNAALSHTCVDLGRLRGPTYIIACLPFQ